MYFVSECLLIKNENQYLCEHIYTNARAGIEHFFIYDNNSDVSVESFLSDYPELQKLCTIEISPDTENKQIDCYKHFLDTHRNDSIYCAFVDTDEMFEGNLTALLKSNHTLYEFKGIVHGCNGQTFYENKTLKERFFADTNPKFCYEKDVVKLSEVITQLPHKSICKTEDKVTDTKNVTLHHYFYKSFEEFFLKIKRGVIQKNTVRKLSYFFYHNSLPKTEVKKVLDKYNVDLDFKTEKNEK